MWRTLQRLRDSVSFFLLYLPGFLFKSRAFPHGWFFFFFFFKLVYSYFLSVCSLKLWSRGLLLFLIWLIFMCGPEFIGPTEPEEGQLLQDQEVNCSLIDLGVTQIFWNCGLQSWLHTRITQRVGILNFYFPATSPDQLHQNFPGSSPGIRIFFLFFLVSGEPPLRISNSVLRGGGKEKTRLPIELE